MSARMAPARAKSTSTMAGSSDGVMAVVAPVPDEPGCPELCESRVAGGHVTGDREDNTVADDSFMADHPRSIFQEAR
ncbi:MAG: hypothetical protein WCF85_21535, partial [Rhodospirillaceae bacterium]